MPEGLSSSSFCKRRFFKMILTRKYVYYPYQVYRSTDSTQPYTWYGKYTYFSVRVTIIFSMLSADNHFSSIENQALCNP